MAPEMTEVDLPEVYVMMPQQSDLKAKTACLCVHCGLYLPADKKEMLFCTGKGGFLCCSGASDVKFHKHGTCSASLAKSYCLDTEREMMGKDGWYMTQAEGKSLFCCVTKTKFKCGKNPFTMLKSAMQCLCCDVRCALPFDREVPMQIAIAGAVLWPKGAAAPADAPAQEEMKPGVMA
jgi:hypothetical protein